MFASPIGSVYFVSSCKIICGHKNEFQEAKKDNNVNAPTIGRTIGSATSHHNLNSLHPSTLPACKSSSGTACIACENKNAPNTLTAPGSTIAQYEFIHPSSYIIFDAPGSITCPGSSIVVSMISISVRFPAKRYFASANPPKLESVTTSTVTVDDRNSE